MKILKYVLGFLLFGGIVYLIWCWGPILWRWFFGKTKEIADNLKNVGPGGRQVDGSEYYSDDLSSRGRNGRKPPLTKKYYKREASTVMASAVNMEEESLKQFQKRSSYFQHNAGKTRGYRVDEVDDDRTGYEIVPYIDPKILENYNTPEKKLRLGKLTPQQMETHLRLFHKSIGELVQRYGSRVSVEYLENLDRWWEHFRNLGRKNNETLERLEEDAQLIEQLDQQAIDLGKKATSAQEEAAKAKKKVNKLTEKLANKKKKYKELAKAKKELEERHVKEHKKATQDLKLKYKEKLKSTRAEIERLRDELRKDTGNTRSLLLRQNGTSRYGRDKNYYNQTDNTYKHQWLEEYVEREPNRYAYEPIKFDD